MHIGGFGEASFGLRGQEAGKLFAGVRYATEQSTSIGCNYVRGTSEDLYIEYIFGKCGLAMRVKVGTETQCAKKVWESLKDLGITPRLHQLGGKKKKFLVDHKRMTSHISSSH